MRNASFTAALASSTPLSTIIPSRSTTTTMLGIACISVLVMSRSCWSCSSRCLRSVTSTPLTSSRRRSSIDGNRMHDHDTAIRRPLFAIQVWSWSRTVSPAATRATRAFTRAESSGATYVSQKTVPPVSSGRTSSVRSNALFEAKGARTPFSSIRQSRLGASFAIAFRKDRSRSRASASSWRAVMSIPPAMIDRVRPCSSAMGAACQ